LHPVFSKTGTGVDSEIDASVYQEPSHRGGWQRCCS
jgi:hypothetical protein